MNPQLAEARIVSRHKPLRYWHVDGHGHWFVTAVSTKARAKSLGAAEWGRGGVKEVRPATSKEVAEYCMWKGRTEADLIRDGEIES